MAEVQLKKHPCQRSPRLLLKLKEEGLVATSWLASIPILAAPDAERIRRATTPVCWEIRAACATNSHRNRSFNLPSRSTRRGRSAARKPTLLPLLRIWMWTRQRSLFWATQPLKTGKDFALHLPPLPPGPGKERRRSQPLHAPFRILLQPNPQQTCLHQINY